MLRIPTDRGDLKVMAHRAGLPSNAVVGILLLMAAALFIPQPDPATAATGNAIWDGNVSNVSYSINAGGVVDANEKPKTDQVNYDEFFDETRPAGQGGQAKVEPHQSTQVVRSAVPNSTEWALESISSTGYAKVGLSAPNDSTSAFTSSSMRADFTVETEVTFDLDVALGLVHSTSASMGCSKVYVSLYSATGRFSYNEKQGGGECGTATPDEPATTTTLPPGDYDLDIVAETLVRGTSESAAASYQVKLTLSGSGGGSGCTLTGTSGNDTLTGTPGDDVICGRGGNDVIRGRGGNDTIKGSGGEDTIFGGAGTDTIEGGADVDEIFGDEGNDTLFGDGGADTVCGDEGNDKLHGGDGPDKYFGSTVGGGLVGGGGADEIAGDEGDDLLIGGNETRTGCPNSGTDIGDTFLDGGLGNDTIGGGEGADTILGHAGNDKLDGQAGADKLQGNSGNDLVCGGTGDDPKVQGGDDEDAMAGGPGSDHIFGAAVASDDEAADVIVGGSALIKDPDSSRELDCKYPGPDGGDTIESGRGGDVVQGDAGSDTITGGPGKDELSGDAGGDTFYARDGDDDDLEGGDGTDRARVDSGDVLSGVETIF
jgi:Ca2+-binding RTX toxin-like protein